MASVTDKMKMEKWKARFLEEKKAEKNVTTSLLKTGAHVLLSAGVGGAAGFLLGKPAFWTGIGLTFLGHYTGVAWLPPVGMGMMATSHIPAEGEGAKDRMKNFGKSVMQKTYADKVVNLISKKQETDDQTTNGFGALEDHNRALKEVEEQLVQSALEFQRKRGQPTSGIEDEIQGMEETDFSGM